MPRRGHWASTSEGREVLTYLDGESGRDTWPLVVPDDGLAAFARLLRRYHDAVAGYRPPDDTEWAYGALPMAATDVVCHGDFGGWNLVWRDGQPVGIVDWDLAYPGPPPRRRGVCPRLQRALP